MTDLSDRMKAYEQVETARQFLPLLPIYARLDGRSFSKFTRDMVRPFDPRMSNAMLETAHHLVAKTNAVIGYTQSDEISLLWYYPEPHSAMLFDRKVQKLVSVLAGLATAAFQQAVMVQFDDWQQRLVFMPHFDARVIQLPTRAEAANMLLWRNHDATWNAVSMAAQAHFPTAVLYKMSSAEMQELLFQNAGVNFNDYPEEFKRGRFVRRIRIERSLTETERARLPEFVRPAPDTLVIRHQMETLSVPPFGQVANRVGFLFDAEPLQLHEAMDKHE